MPTVKSCNNNFKTQTQKSVVLIVNKHLNAKRVYLDIIRMEPK